MSDKESKKENKYETPETKSETPEFKFTVGNPDELLDAYAELTGLDELPENITQADVENAELIYRAYKLCHQTTTAFNTLFSELYEKLRETAYSRVEAIYVIPNSRELKRKSPLGKISVTNSQELIIKFLHFLRTEFIKLQAAEEAILPLLKESRTDDDPTKLAVTRVQILVQAAYSFVASVLVREFYCKCDDVEAFDSIVISIFPEETRFREHYVWMLEQIITRTNPLKSDIQKKLLEITQNCLQLQNQTYFTFNRIAEGGNHELQQMKYLTALAASLEALCFAERSAKAFLQEFADPTNEKYLVQAIQDGAEEVFVRVGNALLNEINKRGGEFETLVYKVFQSQSNEISERLGLLMPSDMKNSNSLSTATQTGLPPSSSPWPTMPLDIKTSSVGSTTTSEVSLSSSTMTTTIIQKKLLEITQNCLQLQNQTYFTFNRIAEGGNHELQQMKYLTALAASLEALCFAERSAKAFLQEFADPTNEKYLVQAIQDGAEEVFARVGNALLKEISKRGGEFETLVYKVLQSQSNEISERLGLMPSDMKNNNSLSTTTTQTGLPSPTPSNSPKAPTGSSVLFAPPANSSSNSAISIDTALPTTPNDNKQTGQEHLSK